MKKQLLLLLILSVTFGQAQELLVVTYRQRTR